MTTRQTTTSGLLHPISSGLGHWHWWWLKQFKAAKVSHGEYQMGVGDWGTTVQGKALAGLMKRGLVGLSMSFGSVGRLALTGDGIKALACCPNVEVCESAGCEKVSASGKTQCAPSDSQH